MLHELSKWYWQNSDAILGGFIGALIAFCLWIAIIVVFDLGTK